MTRLLTVVGLALAWLLLSPEPVRAWGPGTHVALGEMVLASLHLLPPAIRVLLERYPLHFLYGSIAADISFAKKYVPEGRHCHHWHVGEEILEAAPNDALRSVGFGYLSHLAADTVAHNLYVPRRLLLTSTTESLGHTYWEHRMDMHVGEDYLGKARRIVMDYDHSAADELFDRVLSRTIFTFSVNRRIFRGMIRFQGHERWQQVFEKVLEKSRFDLPDPLVERYLALSYDYVVDRLVSGSAARPAELDPIGDLNLRLAKKVRHLALADGASEDPSVLHAMADDFFPFPDGRLVYWPRYREEGVPLDVGEEMRHPPGLVAAHPPDLESPFHGDGEPTGSATGEMGGA
ncbi:MAG: zinc dependent phospholipase C family protein [Gemmatimonadota bacterium]